MAKELSPEEMLAISEVCAGQMVVAKALDLHGLLIWKNEAAREADRFDTVGILTVAPMSYAEESRKRHAIARIASTYYEFAKAVKEECRA